jgi:hypothetical protein
MEKIQKIIDNLFEKDINTLFEYYETLDHCLNSKEFKKSYIYLINCDKYNEDLTIEFKEPLYKIGKTENTLKLRLKQYHKDNNIKNIYALHCKDSSRREQLFKNFLLNKTKICPCIGQEYFKGTVELLRILLYIFGNINLIDMQDDTTIILNNVSIILNMIYNRSIEINKTEFIYEKELIKPIKFYNKNLVTYEETDENNDEKEKEGYICEFCNKEFLNKSNLSFHQKTAKFCLKIQQEKTNILISPKEEYKCDFCNKLFNIKSSLTKHSLTCKKKSENKFENLETENKTLKKELEDTKHTYKKELEIAKETLKEEIKMLELKHKLTLRELNLEFTKKLEKEKETILALNNEILYLKYDVKSLQKLLDSSKSQVQQLNERITVLTVTQNNTIVNNTFND